MTACGSGDGNLIFFFSFKILHLLLGKMCIVSVNLKKKTVRIINEYIIRHVAQEDDMKHFISTSILVAALHISVVILIWFVNI